MTDQLATDPGLVDELLVDSALRLFSRMSTFEAVQAAEAEGWASELWQAVAEAGFAWIGVPETAGGSGGTLADACEVLRTAGGHAAPIPLAETGILGGWLLAEAGLPLPDGPVSVVPGAFGDTLEATLNPDGSVALGGSAARVPWARRAERVVALVATAEGDRVVSIPGGAGRVEPGSNLAGEPRDSLHLDGVTVAAEMVGVPSSDASADNLRLRGALSRVMMMAGALEAMSRMTVDYTEQRQQFGRPVARFQAVQQHLVWGAQDAAITKMAAQVAARQASRDFNAAHFEIASARAIAEACASTATRWAHQAHGAMGMTQEYALHHLSRRLWSWRSEYTTPHEWTRRVGRMAEAAGPDGLFPLITG
jgi:acyl-CoA dehydrogenase